MGGRRTGKNGSAPESYEVNWRDSPENSVKSATVGDLKPVASFIHYHSPGSQPRDNIVKHSRGVCTLAGSIITNVPGVIITVDGGFSYILLFDSVSEYFLGKEPESRMRLAEIQLYDAFISRVINRDAPPTNIRCRSLLESHRHTSNKYLLSPTLIHPMNQNRLELRRCIFHNPELCGECLLGCEYNIKPDDRTYLL